MLPGAPLAAFAAFGRHMVASWDIDPVYPVLRQVIDDLELDEPSADWLTILYLAYYELASAVTAFTAHPNPADHSVLDDLPVLKLPTGIERRGLRSPDVMATHLSHWLGRFDGRSFFTGAKEVMMPLVPGDEDTNRQRSEFNNGVLSGYLQSVAYNGRWAAYKGTEVLHKVRSYPNVAVDAGHENSTGPREGLTLFFPRVNGQRPTDIALLDRQTDLLIRCTAEHGCPLTIEEVETLLCDFRSLTRGAYYVGHDTDLMLEGALRASEDTRQLLLQARRALPDEYRGEAHGWGSRDRKALGAYADGGAILYRARPDGHWEDAA